jgi:hypothetical protein
MDEIKQPSVASHHDFYGMPCVPINIAGTKIVPNFNFFL